MAASDRYSDSCSSQLEVCSTYDEIVKKSKDAPDQLIVVLFSTEHPSQNTIENRLGKFQNTYEQKKMQFFKFITNKTMKEFKKQLGLGLSPAFLILRNGEPVERINDLDESDVNKTPDRTPLSEENNDEKTVKAKLDELAAKYQ